MSPLLGRHGALALGHAALEAATARGSTETEVTLLTEDSGLTRYAESHIHQHVTRRDAEVRVRVVVDGDRVAVATGNQLRPDAAADLARRAVDMARHSPRDLQFSGLPRPSAMPYVEQTTYYEATAALSPGDRAQAVADVVERLTLGGARGYGVVTSGTTELAVVNSHGVHAYQPLTDAWLLVLAERGVGGPTGYATAGHRDWTQLDPRETAARALSKTDATSRRRVKPGRYTVLLEEEFVGEMLAFLGYSALNGLDFLEGRSAFSGRLGESPFPDHISLRDDPTDPRGANVSFDFEGVPKAPVVIIREGMLVSVAWDSTTARRARTDNTAHALPAPNPDGPVPTNLLLEPGRNTRHELLAGIECGLLLTRSHYTNDVDATRTLLTGTTRDGTFLIERGEIVAPLPNLRWLHSIEETLARSLGVGRELRLISEGPGYGTRFFTGTLAPALLVEGFQILGEA